MNAKKKKEEYNIIDDVTNFANKDMPNIYDSTGFPLKKLLKG